MLASDFIIVLSDFIIVLSEFIIVLSDFIIVSSDFIMVPSAVDESDFIIVPSVLWAVRPAVNRRAARAASTVNFMNILLRMSIM